jgi:hypothetical protein
MQGSQPRQTPPFDRLDRGLSALRFIVRSINDEACELPLRRHELGELFAILSKELDSGLREVIRGMEPSA